MAEFRIDDKNIQKIIAEHILSSITSEKKDELLGHALSFLVNERPSPYGRSPDPSPLMEAFRQEVTEVAKQVVKETVNSDEIAKTIKTNVRNIVEKWVRSESYNISSIVSKAIEQNVRI